MEKELSVKVWVLLLSLLLSGLFLIVFGWSIKSTLSGSNLAGFFGRAAVQIASFPTKTKSAISTLKNDTFEKDKSYRVPAIKFDASKFNEVVSLPGINIQNLLARINAEYIESAKFWRILVGVFTVDGEFHNAAIALDPELNIVRKWLLTEQDIEGKQPRAPYRKFVHGFDILKNGSIIFAFGGGVSLQRFDQCGNKEWAIPGEYHHSVSLNESQESVWTLLENNVVKIATSDGKIEQQFSMDDIIKANPTIDILQIRQVDVNDMGGNSRNTTEEWLENQFHLNDVDPLPNKLAAMFPEFKADDLLISARSLNLVFVVDPENLKVKWWRMGATRRQHDPDWGWNGEIVVYDNRMSRDYSRIISISPKTFETTVKFDGQLNNFYSRIRGKQQFTQDGTLIVASPQQGRIFEISPDGEISLEFINMKSGDTETSYSMSQAILLSSEESRFFEEQKCAS